MKYNQQTKVTIRPHDVLCGRGGHSNNHPGNKLFRRIIQENKEIYHELCDQSTKKQMLVSSIIQAIHQFGGRFLRKHSDGNMWVEVSEKEARAKTTQALREQPSSSPGQVPGRSKSPQHSQFRAALRKSNPSKVLQTPDNFTDSASCSTPSKGHVRRVSRDYSFIGEEHLSFEDLPRIVKSESFESSFSTSSSSSEAGVWALDDAVLGDITNSIEGEMSPLVIEDDESDLKEHITDILEDPFCPLDWHEFDEYTAEFGRLCSSLLDILVQ